MCLGAGVPFYTNLYPFKNDPDVPVRVLFFPVPKGTPAIGFSTPFILRDWDHRDQLEEPSLGIKYDDKVYYKGPLPTNLPGEPCGTAAQWEGDIDLATYLAGGYSCDCPVPIMPTTVISVRNLDGSLFATPTTGDVIVSLNTGHTNAWTAEQYFDAFVYVQNGQFEVNNSQEPPVTNLTSCDIFANDDGTVDFWVQAQPIAAGNAALAVLTLRPDPSGKPARFEFTGNAAGQADVELDLTDAAGGVHQGQTGQLLTGATCYGGIVDFLGTGKQAPVIYDSFTDAASPPLAEHVISPINVPGAAWAVPTGVLVIQGGVVIGAVGVNNAVLQTGLADLEIEAGFLLEHPESGFRVLFRYVDPQNYWLAQAGGNEVLLGFYQAGVLTTVTTAQYSCAVQTGLVLLARLEGETITVTLESANQVALQTLFAASTTFQNVGYAGFALAVSAAPSTYCSYFVARPL